MAATGGTDLGTLANLLPSIIAEAMFVANERSIMTGLVKNYTLPEGSGTTVNVPIYGQQTAIALTEGVEMLGDTTTGDVDVTPNTAPLTVSESGIMTFVTDIARKASASNVVADVGRLFGEAIARKRDRDLTALFTNFTAIEGSNITTITPNDIFKAVARLKALGVSTDGMACVLNPEVIYDLTAALTASGVNMNGSEAGNEAMREGFAGRLAGIPIYESSNVVSTSGDSVGGVFHRDALGIATMSDIKFEIQRDASKRGDEIVAVATYGVGVLYDAYGIEMNFDSTLAN